MSRVLGLSWSIILLTFVAEYISGFWGKLWVFGAKVLGSHVQGPRSLGGLGFRV